MIGIIGTVDDVKREHRLQEDALFRDTAYVLPLRASTQEVASSSKLQ